MNFDSSARLLSLWDCTQGEKPGRQGLSFLVRFADLTTEEAGTYRVGERDLLLLRMRVELFGREAQATSECPACGDVAEFTFDVDSLIVPSAGTVEDEHTFGDYRLAFRSPTAQDAAWLCSAAGIEAAEELLLRRCIRYLRCGAEWIPPDRYGLLPRDLLDFISNVMERADPQAATEFEMNCPSCDNRWSEVFDVVSFLAMEIADAGNRIFREIHDLAIHYGWAETEILNMHPARRRMYLTMAET